MTITLKAAPKDDFGEALLTLNFAYNLFKDSSDSMNLLRNLYMSFMLSFSDFEALKQDAMRLLHTNPSLVNLLRTPPAAEQLRFMTVGGSQNSTSLHQLYKGSSNAATEEASSKMTSSMDINIQETQTNLL